MTLGFHQTALLVSGAWPVVARSNALGPCVTQAKTHAQKWIPVNCPTKPFSVSQFPASMFNIAI